MSRQLNSARINKVCPKCKVEKSLIEFRSRNNTLCSRCKSCRQEGNREYYQRHKERYAANGKRRRKEHPEEVRAAIKAWGLRNKEKVRQHKNAQRRLLWRTDVNYKLVSTITARFKGALRARKIRKTNRASELLGCSIENFKIYIESLFQSGMDWSNYGYEVWHLDHIIPCAAFDLSKESHRKICFHFSNYQPMFRLPNMMKSDSTSEAQDEFLRSLE